MRGTVSSWVDAVQDFLIKLGIKPHMYLWEIGILSLNNVIVRPTKIMNRANKKGHIFRKQSMYFNKLEDFQALQA